MLNKIYFSLICIFTLVSLTAQTFTIDGINYTVTAGENVQVAANNCYTGALIVPSNVTNNGITYSVNSFAVGAFRDCVGLTSVTIPTTMNSIEFLTFLGCTNLSSVTIPNSVTSIRTAAFSGCTSLTSISIPNSVTTIENSAFSDSGLTSITIPDTVISVYDAAFRNCNNLTTVVLSNSMSVISNETFSNCKKLTSVTIPNSIKGISLGAFSYCSSLSTIKIPSSVTSIGNYVFYGCTGLTSLICDIAIPLTIDSNVFFNVNQSACSLIVPETSLNSYKIAPVWMNFNPIQSSLSTNDFKIQKNVILFPNPVHNEAVLELKNSDSSQLEVSDMNGKLVLKKSLINNSKNTIDTSNLPKGVYLFKVGKSVTKVIKD